MSQDLVTQQSPALPHSPLPVPAIIAGAGEKASEHFLEFFAATIRNKNTRPAYVQAAAQFFAWCEEYQLQLSTIRPLHVSAYIESKPVSEGFRRLAQNRANPRLYGVASVFSRWIE